MIRALEFTEVVFDVPVLIIKDSRNARTERPRKSPLLLRSLPWQRLTLIHSRMKRVLIALKAAICRDSAPSTHQQNPIRALLMFEKDG